MATVTSKTLRFSRFDQIVVVTVVAALAAIGFLIWRGDTIGLQVVALSPTDGDGSASTRGEIKVRFDAPLAAAQSADAVTLEPPVAGSVRTAGDQLIFTPSAPLAPGVEYVARVETGVRSEQGRTLDQPLTWRFRTRQPAVLYSSIRDGVEQLFSAPLPLKSAAQAAGERAASQLTDLPGGVWDFTVAPSGSPIIFSAVTREGSSDLWSVTAGDDEPVQLLACPQAFCSNPALSPDGRLLLYSQRNANDFAAAAVSPPRLYIMDLATAENAPVFPSSQKLAFDAHWSPDGNWITYLSPDFVGLGVTNLEDGQEATYPTETGEAGIWSPRDNVFVMSRLLEVGDQQVVHLFLVDPVTKTELDISGAESLVQDGAPVWSPDGEWLVFRRNELAGERQSLSKQLWLMRPDGSEARPAHVRPGRRSWNGCLVTRRGHTALSPLSAQGSKRGNLGVGDGYCDRRTMAGGESRSASSVVTLMEWCVDENE
ncbi:MAG: Ig-like domain-containing protein [Anaerolineales bacterium]|nr:Ig-like domain-containing protein [Anaerolineales bacterium]